MLDVSSHGRVAPKTKTINVNANLLSQRLAEREHVREWVRRRLIFIAVCIVVAFLVLPPLHRAQKRAFANAASLKGEEANLSKQLADLQQEQQKIKPKVDNEALLDYIRKNSHEFLGHIFLFLDNVSPSVGLGNFKAAVAMGGLDLSAQADAINYHAAQEFVAECEHGPHVQGTFVSSMRTNPAVGEEGVTFDFSQKVKVGP